MFDIYNIGIMRRERERGGMFIIFIIYDIEICG